MDIYNIIAGRKKLERVSGVELHSLIQQIEYKIKGYLMATRNYPKDRWDKYGRPYLQILRQARNRIRQESTRRKP